jgi:hypothetical protein
MDNHKQFDPSDIYPEVKNNNNSYDRADNLSDEDRHNRRIEENFKAERAAKIANEDLSSAQTAIVCAVLGIFLQPLALLAGFFAYKAIKAGNQFELETGARSKAKTIAQFALIIFIINVAIATLAYFSSVVPFLKDTTKNYQF